jgi:hypothetical protein
MPRKNSSQREAERLLATIRSMKDEMLDEPDPARRRYTARLLRVAHRQVAAYLKGLQILSAHPDLGPGLEQQVQLFMLLEDECRPGNRRRRPV